MTNHIHQWEGLSVDEFFAELDKLHEQAKTDPVLRMLGEGAKRVLEELWEKE